MPRWRLSPFVTWPVLALMVIFCAYRTIGFQPQPLDSAQTLRPVLYAWFTSFLGNFQSLAEATSGWTTYCIVAMSIPAGLAFLNLYLRKHQPPRTFLAILCSRWLWFASIVVFLIVCRFPILLLREMNPDETQFIAAAEKLFHDPVFFRAVDCGTVGPLDIFPLMLPAVFGFSPDYASSRLIGLVIVILSVYILYRAFASIADDSVARLAILPMAGTFAVFKVPDLLHYSSEHVPVLLSALTFYLCIRILRGHGGYNLNLFLLGMLAGVAFFAKMQSVPIVVAGAAVALIYLHATGTGKPPWRPAPMFCLGLAPLWVLNAVICGAAGVWHDFWMQYIAGNLHYRDSGIAGTFSASGEQLNTTSVFQLPEFAAFVVRHAEIRWPVIAILAIAAMAIYRTTRRPTATDGASFLPMSLVCALAVCGSLFLGDFYAAGLLVLMILAYCLLWYRTRALETAPVRWSGILAFTLFLAGLFSVYAGHNYFTHYLLLLTLPLCAMMAWPLIQRSGEYDAVAATSKGIHRGGLLPLAALFVILNLSWQGYLVVSGNPKVLPIVPRTVQLPDSALIGGLTKPGEEMIVWGWNARPYLESGLAPATHDTNMTNFFRPPEEIANYHRRRFLQEAGRQTPPLFIDAVGAIGTTQMADRKKFGYEVFPDVRSFVESNYVFLTDAYGERFFLRKDLLARANRFRTR